MCIGLSLFMTLKTQRQADAQSMDESVIERVGADEVTDVWPQRNRAGSTDQRTH